MKEDQLIADNLVDDWSGNAQAAVWDESVRNKARTRKVHTASDADPPGARCHP